MSDLNAALAAIAQHQKLVAKPQQKSEHGAPGPRGPEGQPGRPATIIIGACKQADVPRHRYRKPNPRGCTFTTCSGRRRPFPDQPGGARGSEPAGRLW